MAKERKRAEIDRHEDTGPARLPARPTAAVPGSEEKVEVMRRRALRRESCFHPLDRATTESRLLWEQAGNGTLVRVGVEEPDRKGPPPGSFGARLNAARRAAGLSQGALARRAGLTQRAVGLYESGDRDPTLAVLCALAEALGKGLDELVGYRRRAR